MLHKFANPPVMAPQTAPPPRLMPPPTVPTLPMPGATPPSAAGIRDKAHSLMPSGLAGFMTDPVGSVTRPVGDLLSQAQAKMTAPPLSHFTHHLGSFKGTADSLLGAAQGFLGDHPERTAGLVGGLLPSVVKPLMGTPFGVPAMAGLHGLLAGGQSGAAAHTYFSPLLKRLGIGGG